MGTQRARTLLDNAESERAAALDRLEQEREQSETLAAVSAQLADALPDSETSVREARLAVESARVLAAQAIAKRLAILTDCPI